MTATSILGAVILVVMVVLLMLALYRSKETVEKLTGRLQQFNELHVYSATVSETDRAFAVATTPRAAADRFFPHIGTIGPTYTLCQALDRFFEGAAFLSPTLCSLKGSAVSTQSQSNTLAPIAVIAAKPPEGGTNFYLTLFPDELEAELVEEGYEIIDTTMSVNEVLHTQYGNHAQLSTL